ncbi:sulfatase [Vallitalea sp.]|jgi:arylsulfatase A-like enzyme|uniref:sulfatase n=1 Tax=Vallitalea sp. TaxID=1882829 RepID=UPI0025E32556|nr:sulfatase [Vallitalea sp.]MCT4686533.1 sulfatase [Vallitalea sp.]
MKAVMVMFDSLNKHYLSAYGNDWTITPNFKRLAEKTVTFDNFYIGSMPCMPARREIHTGRYNFLHKSWSPIDPFDVSMPELLKQNNIHTHLVSDHFHYWEDGGATYHNRFSTYDFIRGDQGDLWKGVVDTPEDFIYNEEFSPSYKMVRQDHINRKYMKDEKEHYHVRAFEAGIEFMKTNMDSDNWYLQLEYFDPHEPFFAPERFHRLYDDKFPDEGYDQLPYRERTDDNTKYMSRVQKAYSATLTMCDEYLGKVLDLFDENNMWEDTMLIVNTDHGLLLGEKNYFGKSHPNVYNEMANTPFFIWDPRCKEKAVRRKSLAQTIDIAPTLLEFFGVKQPEEMLGVSLSDVIKNDTKIHDYVLFGYHGKAVNITDGRFVYMRHPKEGNQPLYSYGLNFAHIKRMFNLDELRSMERELFEGFKFTKGVPVIKIPVTHRFDPKGYDSLLFDLKNDPIQQNPITNTDIENILIDNMIKLMEENDSPVEQYERLNLSIK